MLPGQGTEQRTMASTRFMESNGENALPKPEGLFRLLNKVASIPNRSILLVCLLLAAPHADALDLRKAVVMVPPNLSGPERKAALMLVEEVEKRTQIRWESRSAWKG